jgi:hypothetical protein
VNGVVTPGRSRGASADQAQYFDIRIGGHLDPAWSESFGRLKMIHTQRGETVLTGPVADQAELHGILALIRDLNLSLISVTRVAGAQSPGDDQNNPAQ